MLNTSTSTAQSQIRAYPIGRQELVEIFTRLKQSVAIISNAVKDMQGVIEHALQRIKDGDRSHRDGRCLQDNPYRLSHARKKSSPERERPKERGGSAHREIEPLDRNSKQGWRIFFTSLQKQRKRGHYQYDNQPLSGEFESQNQHEQPWDNKKATRLIGEGQMLLKIAKTSVVSMEVVKEVEHKITAVRQGPIDPEQRRHIKMISIELGKLRQKIQASAKRGRRK